MSWISKDLMSGLGCPMILSIIRDGETYGYEIIKRVRSLTNDQIIWQEGSLYPLLNKLETRGFIKSEWKQLDAGGRRRYYTITEAGQEELLSRLASWKFVTDSLIELNQDYPECMDILIGTDES